VYHGSADEEGQSAGRSSQHQWQCSVPFVVACDLDYGKHGVPRESLQSVADGYEGYHVCASPREKADEHEEGHLREGKNKLHRQPHGGVQPVELRSEREHGAAYENSQAVHASISVPFVLALFSTILNRAVAITAYANVMRIITVKSRNSAVFVPMPFQNV